MMANPLLVIIILLCLLVLSCNARNYGMNNEDSLNQSHKVLEKFEEKIAKLEEALDNSHGRIRSSIIIDHEQESSISPQIRPRKSRKIMKQKREARISAVAKKSSVVSWRIPSKHRHDQHPGVYSDYPKPRSRPPSHN